MKLFIPCCLDPQVPVLWPIHVILYYPDDNPALSRCYRRILTFLPTSTTCLNLLQGVSPAFLQHISQNLYL